MVMATPELPVSCYALEVEADSKPNSLPETAPGLVEQN
ncbi:hypothetical protein ACVILK_003088 [Bradyrhizobium embrapense]